MSRANPAARVIEEILTVVTLSNRWTNCATPTQIQVTIRQPARRADNANRVYRLTVRSTASVSESEAWMSRIFVATFGVVMFALGAFVVTGAQEQRRVPDGIWPEAMYVPHVPR